MRDESALAGDMGEEDDVVVAVSRRHDDEEPRSGGWGGWCGRSDDMACD